MASFRSTPTTRPAPASSAATRATMPVPHATSSTRWPGLTPARSQSAAPTPRRAPARTSTRLPPRPPKAGTFPSAPSPSPPSPVGELTLSRALLGDPATRSRGSVYDRAVSRRDGRASGLRALPSEPGRRHAPASGRIARESEVGGGPAGDPLSDVLRSVRLTGALFFNVEASSPWVQRRPPPRRSAAVLPAPSTWSRTTSSLPELLGRTAGIPPVRLEAGDVVVIPHGDAYALASRPGTLGSFARRICWPGSADVAGGPAALSVEGEGGPERARLCGFLGCDIRPFNPVLAALPRLLHVRASGRRAATGWATHRAALAEVSEPRAGRGCVILRISELLFVEVVRRHLAGCRPSRPGGWRGCGIPRWATRSRCSTGPRDPWTLEVLARGSRACPGRPSPSASPHLVGQPPMQYLARWRMQVAARLLAEAAREGVGRRPRGRLRLRGGLQPGVQEGRRRAARRMASPPRDARCWALTPAARDPLSVTARREPPCPHVTSRRRGAEAPRALELHAAGSGPGARPAPRAARLPDGHERVALHDARGSRPDRRRSCSPRAR